MSHPYKLPPMDHQVRALKRAWRKNEFALFHEMGTGKTFTTINLAAARFLKGQVNSLIVICPTPIKMVWEEQLEEFCPVEYESFVLMAGKSSQKSAIEFGKSISDKLKVLVVGVEALSQGSANEVALSFAARNDCMIVCDESSRLKNGKASRTKKAIEIAQRCLFRVILTGTYVTQGIEDLYGQFAFLNPGILGCKSFFQFRNRYCVMGGFENRKVIAYQNTDDLMKRIAPYIDIVKKHEVLDLPPKIYERMIVEPSPNQLKLIRDLKDTFEAEHLGDTLITETILERLTRFQQIIGGHFPFMEEPGLYKTKRIDGPNPKLDAMMGVIDDLPNDTKVIIWARFIPEAVLIRDSLAQVYGKNSVVTFIGMDDNESRKTAVRRFQHEDARFIISNPSLGGMGQTWTAATAVIYYSNSFSFEDRMQSEDRAHRKGQERSVTYIDIEANHAYDKMILKAIKNKSDIAKYVEENIHANQVGMI